MIVDLEARDDIHRQVQGLQVQNKLYCYNEGSAHSTVP